MKLPKDKAKIKIGPFTYQVFYNADLAQANNAFACADNEKQKIWIDSVLPKERQLQSFLHEIIHACTHISGISYRFDDKNSPPNEEEVVKATSMVLYGVMQDNKGIFS